MEAIVVLFGIFVLIWLIAAIVDTADPNGSLFQIPKSEEDPDWSDEDLF